MQNQFHGCCSFALRLATNKMKMWSFFSDVYPYLITCWWLFTVGGLACRARHIWHVPLAVLSLCVFERQVTATNQSRNTAPLQPIDSSLPKLHFHLWTRGHFLVEERAAKRVCAMWADGSGNTAQKHRDIIWITGGVCQRPVVLEHGGKYKITFYFEAIIYEND